MKKLFSTILLVLSLLAFPLSNYTSAAEMSAGVSTWYTYWKFSNSENMDMEPGFMYGPVLSFRLSDNWSVAGVFLYGKFDNKGSNEPDKLSRYDSDISLNYNINKYFKIFGGGKLLAFTWTENGSTYKHWSAGPGLGIGTTLPVTNNIFFLFNVSGTYTKGNHEASSQSQSEDQKLTETGINTAAAFAYYIASASTSVNLGFRYHYIYMNYDNETSSSNRDEGVHFYGVTLSAVYSF